MFWLRVPTAVMFFFAQVTELVHGLVGSVLAFEPLLTKAEVCKVGCTHFMAMAEAHHALGYQPVVPYSEAMLRVQTHFAPHVHSHRARQAALLETLLIALLCIALVLAILMV